MCCKDDKSAITEAAETRRMVDVEFSPIGKVGSGGAYAALPIRLCLRHRGCVPGADARLLAGWVTVVCAVWVRLS